MIKELKMYTVICDNCGADVNEGGEYAGFNDEGYVESCAQEADWYVNSDVSEHYCPDCFSHDDRDNLILNEDRRKLKKTRG